MTAALYGNNVGNVLRYRPVRLIDAISQQFAREAAGIIQCTCWPAAPNGSQ